MRNSLKSVYDLKKNLV